jgi:hypothetical protein
MATTTKPKKSTTGKPKPKKLSKAGKWMRAHPKGYMEILDMQAVLQ